MNEQIILVDKNDRALGPIEKLAAHQRPAKLHRAFSIFIFNSKKQMLLQLRARGKYHFGGLWTNACCSHPRWGEELENAARRRLWQECRIKTRLREVDSFIYRANFNAKIAEHEFDHVFVGKYDGKFQFARDEVDGWALVDCAALLQDVKQNPGHYTPWFKIALRRGVLAYCG
jgi:isopentenyl-diphosphate delta-isomerase